MTDRRCGTCARGFYRPDGAIACGAPVDEDAILGRAGVNPIWAERKYGISRLNALAGALGRAQRGEPPMPELDERLALVPEGADAECMDPRDGAECKMWQAHPELAGDDEYWRDFTVLGSQYEEQISDTGKHRHRPLKFGGNREFGEERGVGDWRPGAAPDRGR